MVAFLLQKRPDGEIHQIEKPLSRPPVAIDGAGRYWLTRVDTGRTITVTLRTAAAPVSVTPPVLSGQVGSALTASPGIWLGAERFDFAWMRGEELVETGRSYTPQEADEAGLTCRITASNRAGGAAAIDVAVEVLPDPVILLYVLTTTGEELIGELGTTPITAIEDLDDALLVEIRDEAIVAESDETITIEFED